MKKEFRFTQERLLEVLITLNETKKTTGLLNNVIYKGSHGTRDRQKIIDEKLIAIN